MAKRSAIHRDLRTPKYRPRVVNSKKIYSRHESITADRVLAACEEQMFGLGNDGFCIACGSEQGGCEPDARKYKCEACGERKVYGAQELMFMIGEWA